MNFKNVKARAREHRGNAGTFPRTFGLYILKSQNRMYVLPAQGHCGVRAKNGPRCSLRGNVPALFPRFSHQASPSNRDK